ncbi:hypothetical protein MPSEU_000376200 [Mayamaea pseudoterrestris]|nr:hypothetical protein MPSEU_000376200 [Mayamaea pseudoterrestris]
MSHTSRGRSINEIIAVTIFVCFIVGFVTVLCIGNFYRAKRAMERQRQKRLARLSSNGGNGVEGVNRFVSSSPKSTSTKSSEEIHLLSGAGLLGNNRAPELPRRRPVDDPFTPNLIHLNMDDRETPRSAMMMSV